MLPLATGGSPAHVLAVDYALRPVLTSMGADHVLPGWFVVDKHITVAPDGAVTVQEDTAHEVYRVTDAFSAALTTRHHALAAA